MEAPVSEDDGIETELPEHQLRFTDDDRRILSALEPVVSGIATFWGPSCEVLLHSLEDLAESVVSIENGAVTGRSIGSPVTDLALKILKASNVDESSNDDQFHVYFSKTADGRPLRSMTSIIRNRGRAIGMLCINFDLSVQLSDIMSILSHATGIHGDSDSPEHYTMSAEELVTRSIELAIQKNTAQRGISPQQRNKGIVGELQQQGIFDIKGAIDMVASELGVSRFTVYNYLRDLRNEDNDKDE
ncbi:MAG TPA: PAS domain-containing protein [Alkalispirochaeta sp.]|nr:PAS domain-containing protein [Alkalispirochaeta sp.]